MEILLYIVGAILSFSLLTQTSIDTDNLDFALTVICTILSFGLASIISVLKNIERKINRRKM